MSCEESFPEGHDRPELHSELTLKTQAGHAVTLVVRVEHYPGETVFPGGINLNPTSPEYTDLKNAEFEIPSEKSLFAPSLETKPLPGNAGRVETVVRLPFVPLPREPGSHELTLPPLPIAIARSSGQLSQLCTTPHVLFVEDPTANTPNAELQADPPPRSQLEIWTAARDTAIALLIALPLAALLAWLAIRYLPRLKKKPAPPPPVPPWELALKELRELDGAGLLERARFDEYLDRVSDTLRAYLGRRYGFDGLESTTRELLRQLGERAPDFRFESEVRDILQRSDLVKFAKRLPNEHECKDAMLETRRIVERTTKSPTLDPREAEQTRREVP